MNWHSSMALPAAYSLPDSWDGEPFAASSPTSTGGKSSNSVRLTDTSTPSPCGTKSKPSTADPGGDMSTSSAAASPAPPSPSPASASEAPIPGTCGPIPLGSLATYDHATRSWRTCQASFLPGTSDEFSGTWPRSGTVSSGIASQRPTSAPLIRETGSGSWPTPMRGDGQKGATTFARGNPSLLRAVAKAEAFPTPTASMMTAQDMEQARWSGNGGKRPPYQGTFPTPSRVSYGTNQDGAAGRVGKVRESLETMARKGSWETFPTPTKSDGDGGTGKGPNAQGSENLRTSQGGPLNPRFVEWLMGFPQEWLSLKPLETRKFRSWLRWHSAALKRLLESPRPRR